MKRHPMIPPWTVQRLAAEARLDYRTAVAVLRGDPHCLPRSRQLIVDAAARLNVAIVVPQVDDVDGNPTRIRAT